MKRLVQINKSHLRIKGLRSVKTHIFTIWRIKEKVEIASLILVTKKVTASQNHYKFDFDNRRFLIIFKEKIQWFPSFTGQTITWSTK